MRLVAALSAILIKTGLKLVFNSADVSASNPLPVSGTAARTSSTTTIPSGSSVSPAVDLQNTALVGFFAPAAWTTAALQIQASADGSTNWGPIIDQYGSAISSWTALTALYPYSIDSAAMLPFRYIRFLSGTVATPVNQGADRVFTVLMRPLA